MYSQFVAHSLDKQSKIYLGSLPESLAFSQDDFQALWDMHPEEYHVIRMPTGLVRTPRWQQAYGADYHYTGRVNRALPLPGALRPLLSWARHNVDRRLNGLLLNWYDGDLGHYIGKHRDSTKNMLEGCPILTISLGAARTFRLRPWRMGKGFQDFPMVDGTSFIMPYNTNLHWTHEVPKRKSEKGLRISITARGFKQ
ncbi:MAG: alpha-ketoglutarate-dependent dioxygenase AlkB [Planctomycetota bacterium]|nr:alpha-ketoglutarate-dependent dioxygenase AlkB [Planctomycetota bacterium]